MSKKSWAYLYRRSAWVHPTKGLRWRTLVRDGFCCAECRRVNLSSRMCVHHIVDHKGDEALFFDPANCQTLCLSCHDSTIKQRAIYGYSSACGPDGYPLDPAHPFNEVRRK